MKKGQADSTGAQEGGEVVMVVDEEVKMVEGRCWLCANGDVLMFCV